MFYLKSNLVKIIFSLVFITVINYAQNLDELSSTVLYLHGKATETRNVNGIEYQIFYKPLYQDTLIHNEYNSLGTGFFIADSNNHLFLVTAQHVAINITKQWMATIKTSNDEPFTFPINMLVQGNNDFNWVYHDSADVAVLVLNPNPALYQHLQNHFLPQELLLKELSAPNRDIPLTTIGFPLGLGVQNKFSPISKVASPASGLLTINRFDNKEPAIFFLLDSPSIGGFSGAPIFVRPGSHSTDFGLVVGGRLACVGLIHGTISDNTGGKLGAVVPSYFIIETISKALSQ